MVGMTKRDHFRWDPFREIEELGDHLNRMLTAWQRQERSGREPFAFADWSPVVDVCETEDEYSIRAEIPEVDKKNLKVTIQNGVLTIQGERKREKEEKGKRFHRIERSYGSFARSFTLPGEVDEERLKADFHDGVLVVHLPKSERAKTNAIEVKVE